MKAMSDIDPRIAEYGEWTTDDAFEGTCDICDRHGMVIRAADPFLSEVYPEDGPYESKVWCRPCYGQRKDDV